MHKVVDLVQQIASESNRFGRESERERERAKAVSALAYCLQICWKERTKSTEVKF